MKNVDDAQLQAVQIIFSGNSMYFTQDFPPESLSAGTLYGKASDKEADSPFKRLSALNNEFHLNIIVNVFLMLSFR